VGPALGIGEMEEEVIVRLEPDSGERDDKNSSNHPVLITEGELRSAKLPIPADAIEQFADGDHGLLRLSRFTIGSTSRF